MGLDGSAHLKQKAAIRGRRLMDNSWNCFPYFWKRSLVTYGAFNGEGRFSQIGNFTGRLLDMRRLLKKLASIRSITVFHEC